MRQILVAMLLCLMAQIASAIPVYDSPGGVDWRRAGCNPCASIGTATSAYDAPQQLYVGTMQGAEISWGPGKGNTNMDENVLTYAANINNDGKLLGGFVYWTGGAQALGISAGSLLMTATIVEFGYETQEDYRPPTPGDDLPYGLDYTFQFILTPTFVDPRLLSMAADSYALMTYSEVPSPQDHMRLFANSFLGQANLTHRLAALEVMEPASALMLIPMAFLLLFRRRHPDY